MNKLSCDPILLYRTQFFSSTFDFEHNWRIWKELVFNGRFSSQPRNQICSCTSFATLQLQHMLLSFSSDRRQTTSLKQNWLQQRQEFHQSNQFVCQGWNFVLPRYEISLSRQWQMLLAMNGYQISRFLRGQILRLQLPGYKIIWGNGKHLSPTG